MGVLRLRLNGRTHLASLAVVVGLLLLSTGCLVSASAPGLTPSAVPATPTVAAQVPLRIRAAPEFESLKGKGQPTLLAVLDETYG